MKDLPQKNVKLVPVSPAAGTQKGRLMSDTGTGESSFLALPYGWPSGECFPVTLPPVGPQGEIVWRLLPGNLLTWAFPLARPDGTPPEC